MASVRGHKTRTRRMTAEQYLSAPPDEFKTELIYGELVMSPSPTDQHQDSQFELGLLLRRWAREQDLGWVWHDLDMVLDGLKNLVYRPDLLFVSKRNAERRRRGRVFGPADLCVEILSPSDKPKVQRRKFTDYERYGVAWYWIIDPEARMLEENELARGVYLCRSEVGADDWFEPGLFPGLQFRLGPLLAGDLKSAVKGKARKLL